MRNLDLNSTDDELRNAIGEWFGLLATGDVIGATDFLNWEHSDGAVPVEQFLSSVSSETNGGRITTPQPMELDFDGDVDDWPIDFPANIVCRWIPGPKTTEKYPGRIADVLYDVPINNTWSELSASFFVCCDGEHLSLELRGLSNLN